MKKIAVFLAFLSAGMGSLLFVKNRIPKGTPLWLPKLLAGAMSPVWALAGMLGALLGLRRRSPLTVYAGGLGAAAAVRYIRGVSQPEEAAFERAFGPGWQTEIPPQRLWHMLPRPWNGLLPQVPEYSWIQNMPFWTIKGTDRQLLCDLWLPPEGVEPSGLAFIYAHGSAWYLFDKDFGTRPLFRHLAAQGHTIMDVAYRLYPETDMFGMLGDVQRAIAWMKDHATDYNVDPQRVVVGGSSAGGQFALLSAYAPGDPRLTPEELHGKDLTVRGVISAYGPVDLAASYDHMNLGQMKVQLDERGWEGYVADQMKTMGESSFGYFLKERTGKAYDRIGMEKFILSGRLEPVMGGCSPQECPERYTLASPISHVHPGCPPSLLIQGEDDIVSPADSIREIYSKLQEAGVPVVNILLPQTEHGFDLVLPRISPPAQASIYAIERFLALMV